MKHASVSSTWVKDQPYSTWLLNDPRSVPAMLRGKGDARSALYEQFCEIQLRIYPTISTEQLALDFSSHVRAVEAVYLPSISYWQHIKNKVRLLFNAM